MSNRRHGCVHHEGKPRLWRTGDPINSMAYTNTKKKSKNDGEEYVAVSYTHLTLPTIYSV